MPLFIESLESRQLLSAYILLNNASPINSYAGVGFYRNPIATMSPTINGDHDNNIANYKVQVRYEDGGGWETPELAPMTSSGGSKFILIKGSHTYADVGNHTIDIKVNGPEGSYDTASTVAHVFEMTEPLSKPATQPGHFDPGKPLGKVDILFNNESPLTGEAGVELENVRLGGMSGNYNFDQISNASDFMALVNWGDSPTWDEGKVIADSSNSHRFRVLGTHTYNQPGDYDVLVHLSGPDGQTETAYGTRIHIKPSEQPNPSPNPNPNPSPTKTFELKAEVNDTAAGENIDLDWGPIPGNVEKFVLQINDGPHYPGDSDPGWTTLKELGPAQYDTTINKPQTPVFSLRLIADQDDNTPHDDPKTKPIQLKVDCNHPQYNHKQIRPEQLRSIMPNLTIQRATVLAGALNKYMPGIAGVNNPKRWAAFLAQTAQETVGMRYLEEGGWITNPNKHYRAMAQLYGPGGQYGHQPDIISPGKGAQGPHYWGRGFLQLTHDYSYKAFSKWVYDKGYLRNLVPTPDALVKNPDLVSQNLDLAALSAAWYWATHSRRGGNNVLADAPSLDHFRKISGNVNGGTNGRAVREQYYRRALQVLQFGVAPNETLTHVNGAPVGTLTQTLNAVNATKNSDSATITLTQRVKVNKKWTTKTFQRVVDIGC